MISVRSHIGICSVATTPSSRVSRSSLWLSLGLASLFVFSCVTTPKFEIDEATKQQLSKLPGKIGVTIERSLGKGHALIERGVLRGVESLPEPRFEASAIRIGYVSGASGLPTQQRYVYRGPYLASPNGRFIAASLAADVSASSGPDAIVTVDTQTNKRVGLVRGGDDRHVDGIAWSPDSKWIAVLKHSSRLTILDRFLIPLTGHGSPLMTYYLHVISVTGETAVYSKISSEVADSWGWMVWLE